MPGSSPLPAGTRGSLRSPAPGAPRLPRHVPARAHRPAWGELPHRPRPRGVDAGQDTHGHAGDGRAGYLSLTYAVTSGLACRRLSPSGRLAGRRHLAGTLPRVPVPARRARASRAARAAAGCASGPCWSLGKKGPGARRHLGDGVARGEQRGRPTPVGQDATPIPSSYYPNVTPMPS